VNVEACRPLRFPRTRFGREGSNPIVKLRHASHLLVSHRHAAHVTCYEQPCICPFKETGEKNRIPMTIDRLTYHAQACSDSLMGSQTPRYRTCVSKHCGISISLSRGSNRRVRRRLRRFQWQDELSSRLLTRGTYPEGGTTVPE